MRTYFHRTDEDDDTVGHFISFEAPPPSVGESVWVHLRTQEGDYRVQGVVVRRTWAYAQDYGIVTTECSVWVEPDATSSPPRTAEEESS